MSARSSGGFFVFVASIACLIVGGCQRSSDDMLAEVRELHRSGKIEESIPLLIELIESGNRDGEVLYRYGRALEATGHPERSIWALDAAMDDPKWLVAAGQQLAINAHRSKNLDLGLAILERLERERPEGEEIEPLEQKLRVRMLVETNRRYEEALELVDQVLERSPRDDEALRLKAAALLGLERPDEAYEVIHAAGVAYEESAPAEGEETAAAEAAGADAVALEGSDGPAAAAADAGSAVEDEGDSTDDLREAYWCAIRASFQRESKKLEEASQVLDACLARFPDSTGLINEAMKLYSESDPARVFEVLKAAHQKSPDNAEIRRALIQAHESTGQFDEVESLLRKRLEVVLEDPAKERAKVASLWVELAGFLIARDRMAEALEAFDEVTAMLGDQTPPALMLRIADALIVERRFDEALEIANSTPVEVHRPMLRGRIAFEQGDYSKAIKELDEAALVWPDNAPTRYYLARAAEGLGDFDRAVEEYRQAIRSDAALSAARERLIRLHLAEGDVREAAQILRFVSPSQKSEPSMAMGILAVEVRSRMGLEPHLDVPIEPGADVETVRLDTVRALARGLRARSGEREAESLLAAIEAKSLPGSRGFFVRERVGLLLRAGEVEQAIEVASKAASTPPEDDHVQLALGRALVRDASRQDEALAILRGVVERRPNDAEAWTALGELAAARGDGAEAERSWSEALRIAPDAWPAAKLRAARLVEAGRRDEADSQLEIFLARDSPYEGEAALELARLRIDDETRRDAVLALARRAVRFGAGPAAVELLARLDPSAVDRAPVDAVAPADTEGQPRTDASPPPTGAGEPAGSPAASGS